MSSIFDKLKTFSFLSEAKQDPPEDQSKSFIFLYVPDAKMRGALKSKMSELGAAVRQAPNLGKPGSYKRDECVVELYDGANVSEIEAYIDKMGSAMQRITLDDAHKQMFYKYYQDLAMDTGTQLEHIKKEIDNLIKQNVPIDSRMAAAVTDAVNAAKNKSRLAKNNIQSNPDAIQKKKYTGELAQLDATIKSMETQIKQFSDEHINKIRSMFKTVDYADKETALNMLVRIKLEINKMKKDGILEPFWEKQFGNKLVDAQRKLGLSEELFNKTLNNGIGEMLAYYLLKFMYTEQKTEDQLAEEYAMVMRALENERRSIDADTYNRLSKMAKEAMETKAALMKGIKEKEEGKLKVETGSEAEGGGAVAIVPTTEVANEYNLKVRIPLNKGVVITDVERFKGKSKKNIDAEKEMLRKSVVARGEVTLFNLMGYTPKGKAAGVIAAYDPFRQHVGETVEVFSRNTLGILGAVMGKDGKSVGEGIGKFLKHELIGDPGEVNPTLAQGEMWLRNKFSVHRLTRMEPKSVSVEASNANLLKEDAAPGATPGGDGMNQPGMIGGMGDPHAPTPDQKPKAGDKDFVSNSGSGDNFNPRKKKEDDEPNLPAVKKMDESVLNFDSFRDEMYNNK